MRADKSWIGDQAFGEDSGALVTVTYKSHQDALLFVRSALTEDNGVGLLQGPKSSGKTTVLARLAEQLPKETALALIDGTRMKPRELLSRMLAQFGYFLEDLLYPVKVVLGSIGGALFGRGRNRRDNNVDVFGGSLF